MKHPASRRARSGRIRHSPQLSLHHFLVGTVLALPLALLVSRFLVLGPSLDLDATRSQLIMWTTITLWGPLMFWGLFAQSRRRLWAWMGGSLLALALLHALTLHGLPA